MSHTTVESAGAHQLWSKVLLRAGASTNKVWGQGDNLFVFDGAGTLPASSLLGHGGDVYLVAREVTRAMA